MAGATLWRHLRCKIDVSNRCFLGTCFYIFLEISVIHTTSKKATFLVTFGSLRGTFGRLLVTKVPQRLPKVSQKRPNGSKAPQKGSEKTTWLAFLEKFDVFSTIFSFSLVLASIWLLLAPIGSSWLLLPSICSYCFRSSPIASSLLLLFPIAS